MLPIRLAKFWFLDSLVLFIRTWQHVISFLEEDLAVGLMFKLLFTPLFHDSSITGKFLSFGFRMIRIVIGLLAFLAVSILIFSLGFVWFLGPLLVFVPRFGLNFIGLGIFLFGIALFLDQYLVYPKSKFWHIKSPFDIWQATKVARRVTTEKLLKTVEVKNLLTTLEIEGKSFTLNQTIDNATLDLIFKLAKQSGAKYITSDYFYVAFIKQTANITLELMKLDLTLEDFDGALYFQERKRRKWRKIFIWDEEFGVTHLKGINRGWLGAPTPTLDSVSIDLTKHASVYGYEDFIGREALVSDVTNILSQGQDRNVCLVGPAGAGKSALVEYLARKIVAGDAPEALATKRLVNLDLSKLLSGSDSEGDIAKKIEDTFTDGEFSQNVIIYLDEIQNFALGDAGSKLNIFSLLLPHLESNKLQFIASTEPENYSKIIEKASSFARVFRKVTVEPANLEDTQNILIDRAIETERASRVKFSYLSLKKIANLSHRLIHDRVLPDSALSVFNEAIRLNKNGQVRTLEVKEIFQKRVNVPMIDLDSSAKETLLTLESQIHEKYIDQEPAVSAIADTLRRSATGLRENNRPIGSFLFVGPTGTGKTELAKILTQVYFKGSAGFLRFDMSEYQSVESINRLIGDAINPGELTEAVRTKPYSLVLLDEFEKAEPKLLNLFLQVLDDGRLTDASGRTIDFTNTIIIATSNAGSLDIAQGLSQGKTIDSLKPVVMDQLMKVFKPELVNRFDSVVIFKSLAPEDLEKIVKIKLSSLQSQMKEQGYLIDFDPRLIDALVQKGFDPVLGARPLRRLLQDTIEANLSKMILENKLGKGAPFTLRTDLLEV